MSRTKLDDTTGVTLDVHIENGCWWATCPGCPGFTAAADSWRELLDLVAEFHGSDDAAHRDWLMVEPVRWMGRWANSEDDPAVGREDVE